MRIVIELFIEAWLILIFLLWAGYVHAQPITIVVPPGGVIPFTLSVDALGNTVITITPPAPPPPPDPPFSASLCPVSADLTGHYTAGADGQIDTCLVASNLKSLPITGATILSDSGGGWQTAPSGYYYHIVVVGNKFYFSPYPSQRYTLTVFYSDGTQDVATVH